MGLSGPSSQVRLSGLTTVPPAKPHSSLVAEPSVAMVVLARPPHSRMLLLMLAVVVLVLPTRTCNNSQAGGSWVTSKLPCCDCFDK